MNKNLKQQATRFPLMKAIQKRKERAHKTPPRAINPKFLVRGNISANNRGSIIMYEA